MQHLIFTPKNADKSSWMAIDSNDKKIHIMHTKEIRNEGITSLLQTLNLVVPLQNLCELDDNCPSGSGQWASSIWKWEECKKTPRTPALNRERITTFWQQWKQKKWSWRTQQLCSNWAIRIQWSFACYPVEGGFFNELKVQIGHLIV